MCLSNFPGKVKDSYRIKLIRGNILSHRMVCWDGCIVPKHVRICADLVFAKSITSCHTQWSEVHLKTNSGQVELAPELLSPLEVLFHIQHHICMLGTLKLRMHEIVGYKGG